MKFYTVTLRALPLFIGAAYAFQVAPQLSGVRTSTALGEGSRRDFFAQVSAIATVEGLLTTGLALPANAAEGSVPLVTLPPMGLGAWAWGDSLFWGCKCVG